MASRLNAGGIGRKHMDFLVGLRLVITGGGPTKGVVTIRVNPDDHEAAKKAFSRNRLEDALSTAGSALMATSVFTSAFQGICVSGLLIGKGVEGTRSELVERAFPDTPQRLLCLANAVRKQALINHRKFLMARTKPKSGAKTGSPAAAAAASENNDDDDDDDVVGGGSDGENTSVSSVDWSAWLDQFV